MERDLSDFHAERDIPVTDILLLNKRGALQSTWRWLRECVDHEGVLRGQAPHKIQAVDGFYSKDAIYGAFCEWHRRVERYDSPPDVRQIWKDLAYVGVIADEKRDQHSAGDDRERRVSFVPWGEADKRLNTFLGR
jgi:hypothetical protein